jgi:hypothetical protein
VPSGGTTGQVLKKASDDDYDLEWDNESGGGSWTQGIDEDGSSFANFTGASGVWSSDGTVIKQTDTTATQRRARFNTRVPVAAILYEADIQLRSSGTPVQGGLLIGYDGTNNSGLVVRLDQGAATIGVDTDGASQRINISTTVTVNTWYTIKVLFSGGFATFYLDGTIMGTAGYITQASYDASYIGLYTYQAEVWFRNIKAWNLTLPS